MLSRRIVVFGASGHSKVVIDAIEQQGEHEIAFLADDDPELEGSTMFGYSIVGGIDSLAAAAKAEDVTTAFIAIGKNEARRAVAAAVAGLGFTFATAIHPRASVGRGASIGEGSVLMAGSIVNSGSVVGEHVIINTGATVDHDCRVGAFVHIAPGAHVCGTVTIGRGSFICAGATVIPNRTIGQNVVVGAGSTVLGDLPDDVVAVGSPARIMRK